MSGTCSIRRLPPAAARSRKAARLFGRISADAAAADAVGPTRPWPAEQVELWPIQRLIPYANNPRLHSAADIKRIAASILKWGWTSPVLADEHGGLIAGHCRVAAGAMLGLTVPIPVIVAHGCGPEAHCLCGEPTSTLRAAEHGFSHSGERAVLSLLLAALFFTGIHLGIAGTQMRDRAIGILGEKGYRVTFAIASVIGLVWLVAAYNRAPYFVTWGMLEWWKPVAIILMLPASLLVVVGLTTPNPTSIAQEGRVRQPPQGIVRVTRHPFLTGVGLWAVVHLIGNGDVASLVFFATWAIVALAGTVSIDAKRRRLLGGAWEPFAAQTSIVPFAAIAAGRNRFIPREIGLWRWAIALLAYVLMLFGHAPIVGVSPSPV